MEQKKVYFDNGVAVEYDNMKIGDLITTYYRGYFELIEIEPRSQYSPILKFRMKYHHDGKPVKSKKVVEQHCDAAYCRPAKQHIDNLVKQLEDRIKALKLIPV